VEIYKQGGSSGDLSTPHIFPEDPLTDCWTDFLADLRPWKTFVTMTFRDLKASDVAFKFWRRWVQYLNVDLFGAQYARFLGHSYFSYALALEFQRRDVPHFHALIDRPIDYAKAHRWWSHAAGFAWFEPIENKAACVRYVSKYIQKDGQLDIFVQERDRTPRKLPVWWR